MKLRFTISLCSGFLTGIVGYWLVAMTEEKARFYSESLALTLKWTGASMIGVGLICGLCTALAFSFVQND